MSAVGAQGCFDSAIARYDYQVGMLHHLTPAAEANSSLICK